jgi:glutamyl-tRNA reductase
VTGRGASDAALPIATLTAHARDVPAAERGRLAQALRASLRGRGLVVETCHRVEGYATGPTGLSALASTWRTSGTLELEGEEAVRHAIAVAVGRDSVVVGEDQVLHQVRLAVDEARTSGGLDPLLERLFASALRAGRRARSWRQGPEPSLATVALAAIERRSGTLRGRPVLVVGAGRMARLAARAATDAGATLRVANRSSAPAARLADELGGAVMPFDPGPGIGDAVGVIVAIGGPWVVSRETGDALVRGAATVVDLSVPTALEPNLAAAFGSRLITADDLARPEAAVPDDQHHLRRLDQLVDRTTADFLAWAAATGRRAAAASLSDLADRVRDDELEALWRRLPDLEPEAREAIAAMTRHVAERLLREPLERLGRDPDGRTERAVREVFAL